MKHLLIYMIAVICLVVAGCTQAVPAPTPTKSAAAPAAATAPAKAAEPTKAQAATPAPTQAQTKKVDYPQKGKAIMIIVPWAPGNSNDLIARLMAGALEKEFGTPVEVVNKPGAGTQVGMMEVARAKPDGYTLGVNGIITISLLYLNEERKANFGRKDFEPVSLAILDPWVLAVRGDSQYKSLKELFDDAKANPRKIKMGTNGYMTPTHMVLMMLEKEVGTRFAAVHFESGPQSIAGLLGGHIDAMISSPGPMRDSIRAGEMRVLGVMDNQESEFAPGAKTFKAQGCDIVSSVGRGLLAPGGTPKEIVDILDGVIKKATQDPEFTKKIVDLGMSVRYMNPKDFAAHWDEADAQVKVMMDQNKAEGPQK